MREILEIYTISYSAVRCQFEFEHWVGDENESRLMRTRGRGKRDSGAVSGSATGLANHLSNLLDVDKCRPIMAKHHQSHESGTLQQGDPDRFDVVGQRHPVCAKRR
jgi:hypothetical protein